MKSFTLLVMVIFLTTSLSLFSQNRKYQFQFSEKDFQTEIVDNFLVIKSNGNYYFKEEAGKPALPMKSITLSIPANTVYQGHKIKEVTQLFAEDCTLFPTQPPIPTDGTKTAPWVKPDKNLYESSKIYPEKPSRFSGNHIMGNYKFITIEYCPFKYHPKERRVELVTSLEVDLFLTQAEKTIQRTSSPLHYKLISTIVDNSKEVVAPQKRSPSNPDDVQYLIITGEEMSDEFQELAHWKTQKGVPAEVITMTEIQNNYPGATDQLKIKNCLHDYYQNKGLIWVLLGGDNTVVPDQDCYAKVYSDPVITDSTIPTDLFYCCFDNQFDWNANGNDLVGELADNIDMVPEIFIGRAPIQTETQATAFVNKTLTHIQDPPMNNFTKKYVSCGLELWNTWGGHSDADWRSEAMWNEIIDPAWDGIKTKYYDTDTDFTGGNSYDVTAAHTTEILNEGYNYFWMATHGGQQVWAMESGSGFSHNNAAALTNETAQGIIVTIACNTNAFDTSKYTDDPCLSEAFLRNENGGAVSYHGSSRYGWGNGYPSLTYGPSLDYARNLFEALFNGNPEDHPNNFAAVSAESKLNNIGNASYENAYRWLMFSINNMGDPEMDLLTQDPLTFVATYPNSVLAGIPQNVTINTGVAGALVCLTDENNNTPVYSYGVTGDDGSCILSVTPNINNDLTLTITAPNYKPAIHTITTTPNNVPFVIVDELFALTSDGDGYLEAGETATIDVRIINLGNQIANTINLQLDKTDPEAFISITDSTETLPQPLNPGDTLLISAAFSLQVAYNVTNNYPLTLLTGVDYSAKEMTWYPQDFTVYTDIEPRFLTAIDAVDKVSLSWRAPFGGWKSYYPGGNWLSTTGSQRAMLFRMEDFDLNYPIEISHLASRFLETAEDPWNGHDEFRFNILDAATETLIYQTDWIHANTYGYTSFNLDYPLTLSADFYLSVEVMNMDNGYPSSMVSAPMNGDETHCWEGEPGNWTKANVEYSHYVYIMDAGNENRKILSHNTQEIAIQQTPPTDVIPGKGANVTLQGYDIYRNDVKVNTAPVTDNRFEDTPLTNGIYKYHVVAVYAEGESCASNETYGTSLDANTVYFDHFSDPDNWNSEDGCGWETTTTEYYSAPSSFTDSPSGEYQNNLQCSIHTQPPVNMLNVNGNTAFVSFMAKYNLEQGYDICFFEVSTEDPSQNPEVLASFTGNNNTWTAYTYDITPYIGTGKLYFSFRMETDQSVVKDGIYIDNFTVKVMENGNAPARFLTAQAYDQEVHLSWAPPMTGGEGWFSYYDQITHYSYTPLQRGQYFNLAELGNPYPMVLEKICHYFYDILNNNWNGDNRYTFVIYNKNGQDIIWESEQLVAQDWENEYVLPNPITLTEDVLIAVKPVSSSGGPYSLFQVTDMEKTRGYHGDPNEGWSKLWGNWITEIYLSYPTSKQTPVAWGIPGVKLENLAQKPPHKTEGEPLPEEVIKERPLHKKNNTSTRDLLGYNLYRNGSPINNTPITNTYYHDTMPHQGIYDYTVKAVYEEGVSVESETQSIALDDVVVMFPMNAGPEDEITLWFDPYYACEVGQWNSLEGSSEVRIHSTISVNGVAWDNMVAWNETGNDGTTTYLTPQSLGQYTFTYTPSTFYDANPDEGQLEHLEMTFNGGNSTSNPWDKEGKATDDSGECINITIPLNYRTVLFEDDFEAGMAHWITTGTWDTSNEMFFTPTHCLSDSPWSRYTPNTETSTTLASGLDCSGYTSLVLEYNLLHKLGSGDYLSVEASTDDFSSFTTLKLYTDENGTPWQQESISLEEFDNLQNLKIRFRLTTDDENNHDGVFIDDVVIKGYSSSPSNALPIPYVQDFTEFPTPSWEQFKGQLTTNSILTPYTGTSNYNGWHEDGFSCHATADTGAIRGNMWTTNHYYWYNTPFIDLGTDTEEVILRFDIAGSRWNNCDPEVLGPEDHFAVVISTNGVTWSNANTLIEWNEGDTFPEWGETHTVNLSAYSGPVKFGFYHGHNGSNTDIEVFIDNVYVGIGEDEPMTIAEARLLPIGSEVTVTGIITNGDEFASIRHFQDTTAGLAAYGNAQNGVIARGDKVTYTGTLIDYHGMLELNPIHQMTVIASGVTLPNPISLEPADLGEEHESEYAIIDTTFFENPMALFSHGGHTIIGPGSDTTKAYLKLGSNLIGTTIPACPVAISGIITQYIPSKQEEGFQIQPRDLNDLTPLPLPPSSVEATSNSNTVTLTWEVPLPGVTIPGQSGYNVYRNQGIGAPFSGATLLTPVTITDLTFFDQDLLSNTTYCYWVESVYADGTTSLSEPVPIVTETFYTLSGTVSDSETGEGIPGVKMVLSINGTQDSVFTNANGYYQVLVSEGVFIDIRPEQECYHFDPSHYFSPYGLTGNTVVDFIGTQENIHIGGSVNDITGPTMKYVTIHFVTAETLDTTTIESGLGGDYFQSKPCGWSGWIIPEKEHFSFEPDSIVLNGITTSLYDQDFIAESDTSLWVSGVVSENGVPVEGVTISFSEESALVDTVYTDASGYYQQSVPFDWYGDITPSKDNYLFSPSHINFPYNNGIQEDKPNQNFEASHEGLPPGWEFVNTGSNHTLAIPSTAPTIDGEPLPYGSWIGVFYLDNGIEKCGGAIQWQGPDSPIIAAYGDDATTPEKDGFTEGEAFTWKFYLYDAKGTERYATAVYNNGPSVYTTNGMTVVPSIYTTSTITHTVNLSDGWSGISSYVVPENDTVEVIFQPVVENLVILKSISLAYWPGYTNQIINWNSYEGYKIKMDLPGEVSFTGTDTEKELPLEEGWGLLPVLTNQAVEVTGFFAPILNNLTIIKSIDGMGVYWPAVNVQTLQYLNPGESYMIKMAAAATVNFAPLAAKAITTPAANHENNHCPYWNRPVETGNTHIIAIHKSAIEAFNLGDYIGAFDGEGQCVGSVQLNTLATTAIAVYGDDPTTVEKEGLSDGEAIVIKRFNIQQMREEEYLADYAAEPSLTDGHYTINGLSQITLLSPANTGLGKLNLKHASVYPNPTKDKVTVHVPGSEQTPVTITLMTLQGQILKKEIPCAGSARINLQTYTSGIYVIRITDKAKNYRYIRIHKH